MTASAELIGRECRIRDSDGGEDAGRSVGPTSLALQPANAWSSRPGRRFYLVDRAFLSGLIQVRPRGSTDLVWTQPSAVGMQ